MKKQSAEATKVIDYLEVGVDGAVEPVVAGARRLRERLGQHLELGQGQVAVAGDLREVAVQQPGDALLGVQPRRGRRGRPRAVVLGRRRRLPAPGAGRRQLRLLLHQEVLDEALHEVDVVGGVGAAVGRDEEIGQHGLLELHAHALLQLRDQRGRRFEHDGEAEQAEEEAAGDAVALRRDDADQALHHHALLPRRRARGDVVLAAAAGDDHVEAAAGGRLRPGLVEGAAVRAVLGEARQPFGRVVGDRRADEIEPHAYPRKCKTNGFKFHTCSETSIPVHANWQVKFASFVLRAFHDLGSNDPG
jgi:hypothetical protein